MIVFVGNSFGGRIQRAYTLVISIKRDTIKNHHFLIRLKKLEILVVVGISYMQFYQIGKFAGGCAFFDMIFLNDGVERTPPGKWKIVASSSTLRIPGFRL